MVLCINGEEFKEIKIPKEESEGSDDANPAIRKIHEFEKEGWELDDTEIAMAPYMQFVFILKRKAE